MINFLQLLSFVIILDLEVRRMEEPHLEDEVLERLPQFPETLRLMDEFIQNHGGTVRFDDYMQEHLFGKGGFYSDRARIRESGKADFKTDATKPEFAEFISLAVSDKVAGKDFLELGGGSGIFKKSYLALNPDTRYISADMSPRLSALQKKAEDSEDNKGTIIASASKLPLTDKSINGVIFGNELIDALPCRTFKVKVDGEKVSIEEEAFVASNGDKLNFEYKPAQRDDFVEEYERFLCEVQSERQMKTGDVISASEQFKPLFKELDRVLNKGKIVLIDYGFNDIPHPSKRSWLSRHDEEQPFLEGDLKDGINRIMARPYETDITFDIDFPFCRWLLSQDPDVKADCKWMTTFSQEVFNANPEFFKRAKSLHYMQNGRGFFYLEAGK